MRKLLCLLACLSLGADWYVAPEGKPHPTGTGKIDNPWDLTTVTGTNRSLPHIDIKPGDTIWMRGGTYSTPEQRIRTSGVTFRSYQDEWAVWDLHTPTVSHPFVEFLGHDNVYADFEIFSSNPAPRTTPISVGQRGRFGVYARSKFHRLVIHDLNGAGLGDTNTPTGGNEMIGCLSYNHGWVEGRNHGHGLYLQNRGDIKLVKACVVFNNFGKGCQVYGSSAAVLENVHFEGVTFFNNGGPSRGRGVEDQDFLYGGDSPIRGARVERVRVYTQQLNGLLDVGYGFSPYPNEDCLVKDCYVTGTLRNLSKFPWPLLKLENNTTVKAPETQNRIFVEQDPTRSTRYIVTVYNWEMKDLVVLPISVPNWKARSVLRYHEVVATGDGVVAVPMVDTVPVKPIGYEGECPPVSKRFNVFVIDNDVRNPPPPPNPDPNPNPDPDPDPDTDPPPPPPTTGLIGDLTGSTLIIKRDGVQTWKFLGIKQFAIYGDKVYRLNSVGTLLESNEFGRLNVVKGTAVKSFTIDSSGVLTIVR